jgi:HPt (histidine-containing phosphotransfer) domain-containing protein
LKRVAGNEALYRKLLLDFHREYAAAADRIRTALAESRSADVERLVHTLKGVAGNLGAMQLYQAAQDLDSALRLGEVERVDTLLPEVERALSIVMEGLEPLAQQAKTRLSEAELAEAASSGVADRPAFEAAIRELAELVRKNDPEAEVALERLRSALRGARRKEVERIAQALDLFDFRAAAKALAALADVEKVQRQSDE